MRLTKAISNLRFSLLITFIFINFTSTDLMAGKWAWTGSAHGCWVFHSAPTRWSLTPSAISSSDRRLANDVLVDCIVSNKGLEVSSITIETHLQRSRSPSSGYTNIKWKKDKLDIESTHKSKQKISKNCSFSRSYYYASTSRISAKLKSGKRLGYSKWFNKTPHPHTRASYYCGWDWLKHQRGIERAIEHRTLGRRNSNAGIDRWI